MRTSRRVVLLLAVVALGGLVLTACGDDDDDEGGAVEAAEPDATIDMTEYAYAVDGELRAGGTLRLRNSGKEFHMLGLGRLKEGKTLEDARAAIESESEDDDAETVEEIGLPGSFMGPGNEADITVPELGAGNYVAICFINVEGEETPHFVRGMIGEFTVTEEEADEPEADATYKVAPGEAIDGPDELEAGYRVLAIERSDDGDELEPSLVRLDEGATIEDFAEATKVFDEGPLPKGAADTLPGDLIIGTFDFEDTTTVYLGLDLTPGTYVLVAEDSDQDDRPLVPKERITITVT